MDSAATTAAAVERTPEGKWTCAATRIAAHAALSCRPMRRNVSRASARYFSEPRSLRNPSNSSICNSRRLQIRHRILHAHQRQSFGRRNRTAGGCGPLPPECRAICSRRKFAFAHEFQRADHRAHLMVQKRARPTRRSGFHCLPSRNVKDIQRLDRRLGLAFGGAKGREIMLTDQESALPRASPPHPAWLTTCQTRPLSSAGGLRR